MLEAQDKIVLAPELQEKHKALVARVRATVCVQCAALRAHAGASACRAGRWCGCLRPSGSLPPRPKASTTHGSAYCWI